MWFFQFWDLLWKKSYMEKSVASITDQREYKKTHLHQKKHTQQQQQQTPTPMGLSMAVAPILPLVCG